MAINALVGVPPSRVALADRFRQKYWELRAESERDRVTDGPQGGSVVRPLRFKSIVVPLDGRRYAEHALPLAKELSTAFTVPVAIESADSLFGRTFDHMSPSFEEAASPRRRDRMYVYLKEIAVVMAKQSVQVTPQLRQAPLSAGSLMELSQQGALFVLAQRPRRLIDPFSLGHSVERLLKLASSPVIFVRGYRWAYSRRKAQPVKHVLAVLDGTKEAEEILPAATAIVEATGGALTLLRVVPGTPYYGTPWAEKEAEAKTYLDRVARAVTPLRIKVETAVRSSNESLGEVILSFAQSRYADLIGLTTCLQRHLVGTIRRRPVRYLVQNSRLPLLMVNSNGAATPRG